MDHELSVGFVGAVLVLISIRVVVHQAQELANVVLLAGDQVFACQQINALIVLELVVGVKAEL